MKLEILINNIEILKISGSQDIDIKGIAYDSRKCNQGYIFAALRGSNFDGHKFIPAAVKCGASVVICEEIPDEFSESQVTFIVVQNSRKALALISHSFFHYPTKKLNVIGITGTNGKTTTTFLLKSIIEKNGERCAIIGTTGIMICDESISATHTTPESLELCELFDEMIKQGANTVVMEVSSHSLDQSRVEGIDFDLALFTNLTPDHLDYHNDMYEYATAKKKLFDMLKPEAKAVIFDNSEFSEYIARDCKAEIYFIGRNKNNHFKIESEKLSLGQAVFILTSDLNDEARNIVIETKLSGKFNIENAAIAASAALLHGINETTIRDALLTASGAPGRMQTINLKNGALALVDYAHTPDALEKALTACREVVENENKGGRLICLFGCGGDRDKTKRPIMGNIASRLADYSVVTSDNPRSEDADKIIEEIYSGIETEFKFKVVEITNRSEAIKYAVTFAHENDIILVAGKGHEKYQIIGTERIHFDDAEEIRNINEHAI